MAIQRKDERRPATALLPLRSRKRTTISPATFALSNVARVPTTGCVRFIDYFDCYAGDSAAPAFMTPKFLPRISFPNAPFAISPEVFARYFSIRWEFFLRNDRLFRPDDTLYVRIYTHIDKRKGKRKKKNAAERRRVVSPAVRNE